MDAARGPLLGDDRSRPRGARIRSRSAGVLPYHLQSYWIAVRRDDVPVRRRGRGTGAIFPQMPEYLDAVLQHEAVFTERFATPATSHDVAFPLPRLRHQESVAPQRRRAARRRLPGAQAPAVLPVAAVPRPASPSSGGGPSRRRPRYGYPDRADLAEPRAQRAAEGPEHECRDARGASRRRRVLRSRHAPSASSSIAHIFYEEMTDEMLDLRRHAARRLRPRRHDAGRGEGERDPRRRRGTAASRDARRRARAPVQRRTRPERVPDRVPRRPARRSTTTSSSSCTPRRPRRTGSTSAGTSRRSSSTNLLDSPGYTANLLALFQREPGLGLVYPPTIHIGYPTMGRGWWSNKPGFESARRRARHPRARSTRSHRSRPTARCTSLARRRCVCSSSTTGRYDDFGGAEAYRDGGLAHILERMPSYAAGELGYHTRTVLDGRVHVDQPHGVRVQLRRAVGDHSRATRTSRSSSSSTRDMSAMGGLRDFVRIYMRLHHPGTGARIRRRSSPIGRSAAGPWRHATSAPAEQPAATTPSTADARGQAHAGRI